MNRHPEGPIDRVVLDDELTPQDFREIFRAVNRDGKLDGLKPYFEEASDERLSEIGGVLSRQVYEEAQSREGLVALIEKRIAKKTFSVWREKALEWREESQFGDEKKALHSVLRHELLISVARHDVGFLSGDWAPLARTVYDDKSAYAESLKWAPEETITTSEIFSDLKKFLASSDREALAPLMLKLKRLNFGMPLLHALAQFREEHGSKGFEGATRGLSAMLGNGNERNKLEHLLKLELTADAPTDGLFLAINEKLTKEPDYIHELAETFRPMASRALAGFLKEILAAKKVHGETEVYFDKTFWAAVPKRGEKNEPSPEFGRLFTAIRTSIERVTGPAKGDDQSDDAFLHNLPIYTTAYALTKWCEAAVLQNKDTDEWKKAPEKDFHLALLKMPVTVKEVGVDFTEAENPNKATPAQELGALGLTDFNGFLQQVAGTQKFGKFQYLFAATTRVPFADALAKAVNRAHETRAVSDPGSFLRALIYPLTRPEEGHAFGFKQFESPNLMDGVNRFFAALPLEGWRGLKKQMFVDLKLGQLSDPAFDTRRLILDFYPEGKLREKVETILNHFPVIEDFDRSHQNLPTAFEAYHAVLGQTPLRNMNAVTSIFSYVGKGNFLAGTSARAAYPAFFKTVKNARPLASALFGLSAAGEESTEFLKPAWKALGKDGNGLTAHLAILDTLVEKEPAGAEALLNRFFEKGGALLDWLEALTPGERIWITAFVEGEDFPLVVKFLREHGSRASLLKIVRELKALSANGYLGEAFQLLGQIRNERMRRISTVLFGWQSSGQLDPLLTALETLLD